jgi:hypothetical protein
VGVTFAAASLLVVLLYGTFLAWMVQARTRPGGVRRQVSSGASRSVPRQVRRADRGGCSASVPRDALRTQLGMYRVAVGEHHDESVTAGGSGPDRLRGGR